MTRSTKHPDADYTINDMGVPENTTRPEDWDRHNPDWETYSEEEKDEWLANHPVL